MPRTGQHDDPKLVTSKIINSDDRLHRLPGADENGHVWKEPFYFIQAADTQFGMIDSFLKRSPDPKWDEEMELSRRLVERCNLMKPRPKFMVICGDLVDAYPGTTMRRDQVHDLKQIFANLHPDIPLVCVCGNHDIGNEPTHEALEEYWRDFGQDYLVLARAR